MSDDGYASDSAGSAAVRAALDGLRDTIVGATLDVAWRQWGAIGGMTTARRRARALVDPEALVLVSLALRDEEPRLADILADWVTRSPDLLSVQRMRNLARRWPDGIRAPLHSLARVAYEEGKDHRWTPLLRDDAPALVRRGNKARATRLQPMDPAALVLRLRLAFGVGIKADVLAFLLGAEDDAWTGVSAVAAATGYTVAAVRKGIRDLAEARLLEGTAATHAEYQAPKQGWRVLLGTQLSARWRGWSERFAFVAAFTSWVTDARERPLSAYVLENRGRALLDAHGAAFPRRRSRSAAESAAGPGEELVDAVRALAGRMLDEA